MEHVELSIRDQYPSDLLELHATDLFAALKGPTLFRIPGRRKEPLLISTLLHGNEVTGFLALQRLLPRISADLPRDLWILLGNVEAAAQGLRRLPEQPDFNRIWREAIENHAWASQLWELCRKTPLFASVDVHNNTGRNPHYGVIASLESPHVYLASNFGRTVVYFQNPNSTFTHRFSDLCPSVTLEAGRPGEESGIVHTVDFLDYAVHLSEIPKDPVPVSEVDIYETIARIRVPRGGSIGVDGDGTSSELMLVPDLDKFNFVETTRPVLLGRRKGNFTLIVEDKKGVELEGSTFLSYHDSQIFLRENLFPSMFTLDKRVIEQDCLGYLMCRRMA